MSAQEITKSRAKIAAWEASRERDRKALVIAEREGISFIEAVARLLDQEEKWQLFK